MRGEREGEGVRGEREGEGVRGEREGKLSLVLEVVDHVSAVGDA